MIQPHLVEHRSVEIRDQDIVFGRLVTQLIGRAVNESAFEPAAGQPERARMTVVIAAALSLGDGQPAEFAAP